MERGQEGLLDLHRALLKVSEYGKIKGIGSDAECLARVDPCETTDEWAIQEAFPVDWANRESEWHAFAAQGLANARSERYRKLKPEDIVAGLERHAESERTLKRIRERRERWKRGERE